MSDFKGDPWTLYASTRDRFIALGRSLAPAEADRVVPLTSEWTVTDVLAHVCGLNSDLVAGMREGLGTDERTAHQVASRAGRSIDEICDEWVGYSADMPRLMADLGPFGFRLHADLVVHLHDVEHALGLPIVADDEATVNAGRTYATHIPDRWFESTGTRVSLDLGSGDSFGPTGDEPPSLALRATPYDFLRSVSGRRSRTQVETLDWIGDPAPLLDHFSPYGPLRSTDAEI